MMDKSLVRQAAAAYAAGKYRVALSLYHKLGDTIGKPFFALNIVLCQEKIRALRSGRDYMHIPLKQIRMACVMDAFTFQSFQPECALFPLTPQDALQELEACQPDLLFIESAWRGKDDLWERKISTLSVELKAILAWCEARAVPTVFWNKEDPVHFGTFLNTAKHFDYVFTTDIDCIANYKAALDHERIYVLPFACQAKLHNPVECYPRKDAFCFAGSYYVRYPDRIRDLEDYAAELPRYKPLEIFDRNFGKDNVNYQFPERYRPYIVGTLPFEEIDKAYKGYRYAINLNSIKHSHSMFARRVFELLASNTTVISNYARGIRVLFGELIINSDSGQEIIQALKTISEEESQKVRLLGLRKVMREHSYERRLSTIAKYVLQRPEEDPLPDVLVAAVIASPEDVPWIWRCYQQQTHGKKRLLLVLADGVDQQSIRLPVDPCVTTLSHSQAKRELFCAHVQEDTWLALLSPQDYYGPNYLLDLAIGTLYSSQDCIGKASSYSVDSGGIHLSSSDAAYKEPRSFPARRSLIRVAALNSVSTVCEFFDKEFGRDRSYSGLSIDVFNYCENGRICGSLAELASKVNDLSINSGITIDELTAMSEKIEKIVCQDAREQHLPQWTGPYLAQLFAPCKCSPITLSSNGKEMHILSALEADAHDYIYVPDFFSLNELSFKKEIESILLAEFDLALQYVIIFFDGAKNRLNHIILSPNLNNTTPIPPTAAFMRFGLRLSGQGTALIKTLLWKHRIFDQGIFLPQSPVLLLTNQYPEYQQLYRNAFVHARVKAYRENNVPVDVFRLHQKPLNFHEFNGIEVGTGSIDILQNILRQGYYTSILVHVLSPAMWYVLKQFPKLKLIIWVHGAEIQPWHRRQFNYSTELELRNAKALSAKRMAFWHELLSAPPANIHLVFVSQYLADTTMEDLGIPLDEKLYTVIHNPIDTDLFAYRPKEAGQRKKILSIRPYASKVYANDLSVKAIELLAEKPFFNELEFRMIGDGPLFESTLEPLARFKNVSIGKRFLSRQEIAALHQEYGVFLCPSRSDTHGVSRDEAMASGLVPVTTAVAAIPEFVNEHCAILTPPEDASALAEGIARLYEHPDVFQTLSQKASARVQKQTAQSLVIAKELTLFHTPKTDDSGKKNVRIETASAVLPGNPAQLSLPTSFFSIDVEALPGRARNDHVNNLIWGKIGNEEYGISRICSILNEYGLKGNFMIDLSACALYGDTSVARAGEYILKQGHELHAHLHSECLVRRWGILYHDKRIPALSVLDEKINHQFMHYAFFKFKELFGFEPFAFRAGGYLFNEYTLEAAKAVGFKLVSNLRLQHQNALVSLHDALGNEPFLWPNGLIEIPIDLAIDPLTSTVDTYHKLYATRLSQRKIKVINLVNHSWSLLRRENEYHETYDPAYEENYRQLCRHLQQHSNSTGYSQCTFQTQPLEPSQINFTTRLAAVSLESSAECNICGALFKRTQTDICPGCSGRARHRQVQDVLKRTGNPFDGKKVLSTHATLLEKAFLHAKVKELVNFDIRPVADLVMDIQNMHQISAASFDGFAALHVLNHVQDDKRALEEIHRILTPGGVALLTIPYRLEKKTEPCSDFVEHYGAEALEKYGVGSFRRYGLNDAVELFSSLFAVTLEPGYDSVTQAEMNVFFLMK